MSINSNVHVLIDFPNMASGLHAHTHAQYKTHVHRTCALITLARTRCMQHASSTTNTTTINSNVRDEQRADDQKVALKTKLVEIACHLSVATTMLDAQDASESNGNSEQQPSIETVVGRGRDPNLQSCAGLHAEYDGRRGAGVSDPNEPHVCVAGARGGCSGGACDETFEQRERRMSQQTWVRDPERRTRR